MQGVGGSSPLVFTKKSRSAERDFFIHREAVAYHQRSLASLHLISRQAVYHRRRRISSPKVYLLRADDMQGIRLDDMQCFALILPHLNQYLIAWMRFCVF